MTQWGFYFDSSACTGCHACEMACKAWNHERRDDVESRPFPQPGTGPAGLVMRESWRRVERHETGSDPANVRLHFLSLGCNHCANPPCVAACPVAHLVKGEERGLVVGDAAHPCIACGRCVTACPWRAPCLPDITLPAGQRAPMTKCDMCRQRLDDGKKPACVAACLTRALDAGPLEELRQTYPEARDNVPFFDRGTPDKAMAAGPSILFHGR